MENMFKYFLKSLYRGVIISLAIACFFIFLEIVFGRTLHINQDLIIEIGYYCLYGVTLTLINGMFFDYLNHEVTWDKNKKTRIVIGVFGSLFLTIVGVFFLRFFIKVAHENISLAKFISEEVPKNYVITTAITMVVSLFFHTLYFYKIAQENKVREQKILQERLRLNLKV